MQVRPANPPGASPLRRGYLASNPRLVALLAASDTLLRLARRPRGIPLPTSPRRVLLALGGHLGDAVIATATIEHLHRSLPDAQLGIVMPGWSRVVIEGDPRLRWIHTLDHWKSNRSGMGSYARWRHYQATRRRALREIRAVDYDVAVDLYGYFPNMALALSQSKIPVRLGFTSGGLGPLYTHAFPWSDDLRQVAERQVELASMLTSSAARSRPVRYALPETARDVTAAERVATLLLEQQLVRGEYVVIHPGTGASHREWPVAGWRDLVHQLVAAGHQPVFTGRGVREAALIAGATSGIGGAINLCDRLGWHELVQVIRHARLLISVESVAAHVAAAVGTPCVALWSGTANAHYWRPLGSHVTLVTAGAKRVSSPGQDEAAASNPAAIAPDEVLSAVHAMLEATPPGAASATAESKTRSIT